MVGQEILVLFIMVRIRAPQPKIKTPLWRFCFWFVATVRGPQPTVAGLKTSRCHKHQRSDIVTVSPQPAHRAVPGNPARLQPTVVPVRNLIICPKNLLSLVCRTNFLKHDAHHQNVLRQMLPARNYEYSRH